MSTRYTVTESRVGFTHILHSLVSINFQSNHKDIKRTVHKTGQEYILHMRLCMHGIAANIFVHSSSIRTHVF